MKTSVDLATLVELGEDPVPLLVEPAGVPVQLPKELVQVPGHRLPQLPSGQAQVPGDGLVFHLETRHWTWVRSLA